MRFTQPAYPTVYFSTLIWVRCPNCDKAARIETKLGKYIIPEPQQHQSTLTCAHCGLRNKHNENWHGQYRGHLNIACGFCGSPLIHTRKPTKNRVAQIAVRCEVCKKEKEYALHWYKYKQNSAIDPYFGLDLWLRISIKENVLWVYNVEHLKYLRDYVSSSLRDDNSRHKYAMIANLPKWVKSAKNRDLIVKKLGLLEMECKNLNG